MTDPKMSFEDILDELMLEEPTPSYAALLRWQERYPRYHAQLADFFATWAVQAVRAEQPEQVPIDEDKLVERGVSHAMEILRRQGRLIPQDAIHPLASFDQLVLTAIYLLHGSAYSVNITDKVSEMLGKRVLLGRTFSSLARLEDRYLIASRHADPETEPEGKTRRYFTVTLAGERALVQAKAASKVVADFLGDFA